MSVDLVRQGNLEAPETTLLNSADAITVHTGLNYGRVIEAIVLANVDVANACEVTLRWVDSTPTAYVFWQGDIAAGTTTVINTIPILTSETGKVRSITAEAENADDISVTVITSAQARAIS